MIILIRLDGMDLTTLKPKVWVASVAGEPVISYWNHDKGERSVIEWESCGESNSDCRKEYEELARQYQHLLGKTQRLEDENARMNAKLQAYENVGRM